MATNRPGFLVVATQVKLNPRGLVLAGIILGTLGMLDDIAIGLSSAVFELAGANPDLPWQELFKRSMVIGVDHFASMVNSLMLAYVGASLPLFLLLMIYQEPLGFTLNREFLVEEIVRTLVGGIGLMLTGPVTSLIACLDGETDNLARANHSTFGRPPYPESLRQTAGHGSCRTSANCGTPMPPSGTPTFDCSGMRQPRIRLRRINRSGSNQIPIVRY